MKRKELERFLRNNDCELYREGSRHTIYRQSSTGKMTAVPRHTEIRAQIVRKICDELNIEHPKGIS